MSETRYCPITLIFPELIWKYTFAMGSNLLNEILKLKFILLVVDRKIGQQIKNILIGGSFAVLFLIFFAVFCFEIIYLFLAF